MIKDREYLCASAFITAGGGKGSPSERLSRYRECTDKNALRSTARELLSLSVGEEADIYSAAISDTVERIRSIVPDFRVFHPLILKYDCTNIKTAIKAAIRGIDASQMMFDCTVIPKEKIIKMAESSSFFGEPSSLMKAAGDALKTYRETGEVRSIDIILDRACFGEMQRLAEEGEIPLIRDIVALRADGANILAAMRIAKCALPEMSAMALMERAFLPGGHIPLSSLISKDTGIRPKEEIDDSIRSVQNSVALREALNAKSFSIAERIIDEAALSLCNKYRYKPFGAEVAVLALLTREAEVMNLRILEAAIGANDTGESLNERIRTSYV